MRTFKVKDCLVLIIELIGFQIVLFRNNSVKLKSIGKFYNLRSEQSYLFRRTDARTDPYKCRRALPPINLHLLAMSCSNDSAQDFTSVLVKSLKNIKITDHVKKTK